MPYAKKDILQDRSLCRASTVSLGEFPKERWHLSELHYFTENRFYLLSCICGMQLESADKVETVTDAVFTSGVHNSFVARI